MADSSNVDAALFTKLSSDSTLMAITTDGIFWDEASQGATKFVIVTQMAHEDVPEFRGTAWEDFSYLVKAVVLGTAGSDVKSAAARIDALLHNGSLTTTGYTFMDMYRTERVRYTEVDRSSDPHLRWQHRGGLYRVRVDPT